LARVDAITFEELLKSPDHGRGILWYEDINGCWTWLKARAGKDAHKGRGYGCLRFEGAVTSAHTAMWRVIHGPIPEGLQILHQCDFSLCVNPSHGRLGTNAENQQEASERGRHLYHCRHTAEQILDIRARCAAGESQRSVGLRYGIPQADVSNIVRRKYWKYV
jgi:hypothetical protein